MYEVVNSMEIRKVIEEEPMPAEAPTPQAPIPDAITKADLEHYRASKKQEET